MIEPGDTVKRNWNPGEGVAKEILCNGRVLVRWPNGRQSMLPACQLKVTKKAKRDAA